MITQKKTFVHIFVLAALALSPLYDVLSKEPNFFLAHKSEPTDFLVLIGMVSIVFPLIIAAVFSLLFYIFGKKLRLGGIIIIGVLIALILLPLAKKYSGDDIWVSFISVGLISLLLTWAYLKYSGPRLFLEYISPAILVFPILFLFPPKIFVQAFPKIEETQFPKISIAGETPVIFILFDEFPLSSLLNEGLLIDETAYPNFNRLAGTSHWFRNTSTNYAWTGHAVMSALTGMSQKDSRLGTYRNFPNNLFTLMGHDYQVHGYESALRLCPPHICKNQHETKGFEDVKIFWMDMTAIFLNLIFPQANKFGVPGISQSYKGFWDNKSKQGRGEKKPKNFVRKEFNIPLFESEFRKELVEGREELIEEFLEAIDQEQKKSFYFLHILLPHMPYRFLSSGKKYDFSGQFDLIGLDQKASKGGTWKEYEWLTHIQYQKFLNQVAYTDHFLGKILDRLDAMKIFDSSLFILSADHGVHIKENGLRREVRYKNLGDIAPVPLFIKLPNQNIGEISDIPATSEDIIPTLADVLGIKIPWEIVGYSLFKDSEVERKRIIKDIERTAYIVPNDLKPYLQAGVKKKQQLFGKFKDWNSFRLLGVTGKKIFDQAVSKFQVEPLEEIRVSISTGYQVQTQPDVLPAIVQGELAGVVDEKKWQALVAVNGIFQAESAVMNINGKKKILAFLPEQAFKEERNEVGVYLVKKPIKEPVRIFKPLLVE